MYFKQLSQLLAVSICSFFLTACLATTPKMGGGSNDGSVVSGSAGGSSGVNQNDKLERCAQPLGTVSIFEDKTLPWWLDYQRKTERLGSTVPVLRLMAQQSNCFVVVERGEGMRAMNAERDLYDSGELRSGSNYGKGQMVAADFTLNPSLQFAKKGTGKLGGIAAGYLGSIGSAVVGGLKKNEASTTLLLVDNRSGVQVSSATGSAKNFDLSGGFGFLGGGFGGLGGFSDTPEGKIITASFADSFNQMVIALRNYKAQEVKGGLGKGGTLRIGQ